MRYEVVAITPSGVITQECAPSQLAQRDVRSPSSVASSASVTIPRQLFTFPPATTLRAALCSQRRNCSFESLRVERRETYCSALSAISLLQPRALARRRRAGPPAARRPGVRQHRRRDASLGASAAFRTTCSSTRASASICAVASRDRRPPVTTYASILRAGSTCFSERMLRIARTISIMLSTCRSASSSRHDASDCGNGATISASASGVGMNGRSRCHSSSVTNGMYGCSSRSPVSSTWTSTGSRVRRPALPRRAGAPSPSRRTSRSTRSRGSRSRRWPASFSWKSFSSWSTSAVSASSRERIQRSSTGSDARSASDGARVRRRRRRAA